MRPSAIEDLPLLVAAAEEGAAIAMGYYRSSPEMWYKGVERSPVSEADIAVDRHLRKRLLEARPGYGWLSEETEDDAARLERETLFVVDPIDGTRAFLAGEPNWCVSAAVVSAGRVLAGVLVAPARGEVWTGAVGVGAALNGRQLAARPAERTLGTLKVSMPDSVARQALKNCGGRIERAPGGPSLALRLARVAAGELDGVLVRPKAKEWDIAGADALLRETGHRLVDEAGEIVRYNRPDPSHGFLLAAAPRDLPGLRGCFPLEGGH